MTVSIKSPEELDALRVAGRLAAQLLEMIGPHVRAGVTTDALNDLCEQHTTEVLHSRSAPLGYHGFPKSICTSVNHVV
ncbi:MAG TPA: type I methionyl aminopeptidase, partial [Gammaproteobacteria bacterium]|nr:type I methionyl aminopeptidase [Gammaproteobacteria bacterium]